MRALTASAHVCARARLALRLQRSNITHLRNPERSSSQLSEMQDRLDSLETQVEDERNRADALERQVDSERARADAMGRQVAGMGAMMEHVAAERALRK